MGGGGHANDHYTTNRNKDTNHIYNPWRLDTVVEPDEIDLIEVACAKMMKQFGYIRTNGNKAKIKDTVNFKTVKPSIFCTLDS